MKGPEDVKTEINKLIENTIANHERQPTKPPLEYKKLWTPSPETCSDVNVLSPLPREIRDKIPIFQQIKKNWPSSSMIDT